MTPMRIFVAFVLCALLAPAGFSQAKPAAKSSAATASADRLGKTCAQILRMTSTEWVAQFKEKVASADAGMRAFVAYGKCYDARTDRLAALLARNGRGPRKYAVADFQKFEQALNEFTEKALAATDPPADEAKSAVAKLYAKEFRAYFYEQYMEDLDGSAFNHSTPESAGDVGEAKNHFGELLNSLPEDKLREIHKAFGRILADSAIAQEMKLELYRYAIFLLEPASATPFAPPPF
jgi:hypothetical protein